MKLTVAFSWNDGYFSNRYMTLWGSLAWAFNAANTLSFVTSGNAGANKRVVTNPLLPTPLLQNNSQVYNLIYTYRKGNLVITPYYPYTVVKANPNIGITTGSHANGGAILANYNFKHGFSLTVRPEYIKSSSGNTLDLTSNPLGYGPDTGAFSLLRPGPRTASSFEVTSPSSTSPTSTPLRDLRLAGPV
jgi:hypothetical protein